MYGKERVKKKANYPHFVEKGGVLKCGLSIRRGREVDKKNP